MSNTTAPTAPAKPAIFEQTEAFLATVPQRKAEIERLGIRERTADHELFVAKRTLLQAQSAVNLAGPDDPQIAEHRHFESQAAEAVTQAHNNLQQARLAIVTAETALNKDQAAHDLLPTLRQAVGEQQAAAIEKFLRDFANSGFQRTLQRGHALASALGIRLDAPLPADAPAPVKALVEALTVMPDASGWADNAQAQTLFDSNKSPSLMLTSLDQHIAQAHRWRDARYKQAASKAFDSAGVFRVHQSGGCTLRGVDYARGSFITLSAIDPAGGEVAIASLKRLVNNGQIQMVAGKIQQPTAATA